MAQKKVAAHRPDPRIASIPARYSHSAERGYRVHHPATETPAAMKATNPGLTPEDFDWLRMVQAATDTKRNPPPVPNEIAGKLRTFGFVTSNSLGGLAITDQGREALLEQDMRDAEDR